jgi:hypothetical protein
MSYIYSLDVYHSLGENTDVDDHQTFMTPTKKKHVIKVTYYPINMYIYHLSIMLFDDVQAAHKFYKVYAHDAGFSVHTGQHRCDDNGVIRWKRFLCARAGYKTNDSSKKMHRTRGTRCGCGAYIYIKRNNEGKYEIAALNEGHNHAFVTPSKHHLLRSNRYVSEKAKTTLFNYHKASIGTSQAYKLLQVGAGGLSMLVAQQKTCKTTIVISGTK